MSAASEDRSGVALQLSGAFVVEHSGQRLDVSDQTVGRRQARVHLAVQALCPEAVFAATCKQCFGELMPDAVPSPVVGPARHRLGGE